LAIDQLTVVPGAALEGVAKMLGALHASAEPGTRNRSSVQTIDSPTLILTLILRLL
jgi:hypothetical protein